MRASLWVPEISDITERFILPRRKLPDCPKVTKVKDTDLFQAELV